ncbi:MAG: hypothetical protein JWP76_667 [Dactylosporangium sp.]|nr:hypothetical protein [Dactylosporangium sp.]
MTLRHDLEQVLAIAQGETEAQAETADLEALLVDGPARRRLYLAALAVAPDAEESALIALVLRDPDRVMAESAMVSYMDSQASRLPSADVFAAWAAGISDMVEKQSFLARRIRDWQLFKALMDGGNPDPVTLAAASNWLQHKVVDEALSAAVLTVMGKVGRTKRVRNLAKTRAGRIRQGSAPR